MNSPVVVFLLAISLAIYQASAVVPTCYITIAGALKFGFFAPYGDIQWRDVKDDGTWGDDTLYKWRDRVLILKSGVLQWSSAGLSYNWMYDAATNCIISGSMDRGSGYVQRPRTYAIVHPKKLTFRVKSNGILTSDKGYVNSQGVKENQFQNFFKHYNPDVDGPYAGFYWSYYGNLLYFANVGGKLHIEKKEGAKHLYFYGIFEKPNEFLLPGAYSDRKLLGSVDSGKACIELAKRSLKPDLTFIKGISYNVETKNCYYCNKEGAIRNRAWKWTSAAVDVPEMECFLYVLSPSDNLYDSYAPWGYKEWRSVDNNDKWSDHYIRLEKSKFYIFKKDGTKLIDEPIGEVWDDGAKCLNYHSQINGPKGTVYVYSTTQFAFYLSNEAPDIGSQCKFTRYYMDALTNLQKLMGDALSDNNCAGFVSQPTTIGTYKHLLHNYTLYKPGRPTQGFVAIRIARPQRPTPTEPNPLAVPNLLPKCFVYVMSPTNGIYDNFAPWGDKEWRSVDNDDKWSDHYIRLEDSKFYIFKQDGSKLFPHPFTHPAYKIWDDVNRCFKPEAQITALKDTVHMFTLPQFLVYLSNESAAAGIPPMTRSSVRIDKIFVYFKQKVEYWMSKPLTGCIVHVPYKFDNTELEIFRYKKCDRRGPKSTLSLRFTKVPRQLPPRLPPTI